MQERVPIQEESILPGREKVEFPKDPQERWGALLSSFNTGTKAVTLLLLPDGSYISSGDLATRFRELVVGTAMASVDSKTSTSYCLHTLCPIGLVAREYTIDRFGSQQLVGFGLTAAGKEYGMPAACLTLDFEDKHKISLYQVLGATQNSSTEVQRAPYTRALILQLLSKANQSLREADIVQELKIPLPVAGSSLSGLKRAGAITYEAVTFQTGETQVSYSFKESPISEIKPYGNYSKMTQRIAQICQELATGGLAITQESVYRGIPKEITNRWQKKSLRMVINNMLSHLADQGYLQRGQFKGSEKLSSAKITAKGRLIVDGFLTPLLGLACDDNIERERINKEVVPKVLANRFLYAQNSARLYYPHSQSFKIREHLANIEKIKNFLLANSVGLTAVDFSEMTGLNKQTCRRILASLEESGEAVREKRKGVNYYFRPVSSFESLVPQALTA